MKTTYLVLAIAFLFQVTNVNAQSRKQSPFIKNYFQISIDQAITGSGHGSTTIYKTSYGFGNSSVGMGIIFQNNYKTASGISAEYNYIVECNNSLNLYFNATSHFYYKSKLSDRLNKELHNETFFNDYFAGNAELEQFNTIESFAGFGLIKNLGAGFALNTGVGIGGYLHKIQTEDYRNIRSIYCNNSGLGLLLKLGISFQI